MPQFLNDEVKLDDTKKRPLISVIVPVYNVEAYLRKCVDSLLAQTYSTLEIILINDGSSDKSGALCDEYAESHDCIKVLHNRNMGLSGARNSGIAIAKGEYIAFVDSDDYVSPVFVEALYLAAKSGNCKMSCCGHGVSFQDGCEPSLEQDIEKALDCDVLTELEYQSGLLYQKYWTSAWLRLCHKSIVAQGLFPEGLLFEDLATSYKLAKRSGTIALLRNDELYAYRFRSDGIMSRKYGRDKTSSCLAVSLRLLNDIVQWYPTLENAAMARCFALTRTMISQVPSTMPQDFSLLWSQILKYRKTVLLDRCARKKERLAALIAMMGAKPFNFFCKAYRRILKTQ